MPDVDNSVALGVKPASFDISSPLMTLAQLQMAKSHSDLYGAQAKYQGLRLNALQAMSDNPNSPEAFNQLAAVDPDTAKNYLAVSQQNKQIGAQQNFGKAVNAGDPNAPNQLAAFPEAYKTGVEATSNRNTDQRAQTNQKLDLIGRAAQAALDAGPDGSKARTDAAHASLDSLLKQGAITQADHDRAYGNVTDAGLKHAVAVSMSPKDYMEASGQTAGLKASAELPAAKAKIEAEGEQTRQTAAAKQPLELEQIAAKGDQERQNQTGAARYQFVTRRNADGSTTQVPATQAFADAGAAQPQGAGGGLPGKLEMTPEQTASSEALGGVNKEIIANESKAGKILQDTQILRQASKDAFRPGARGEERANLARNLVDMYQSAGAKPPDVVKQAATGADVIDKIGGQMTTDIVRSLGTREALGIYQAVGRYMPNNKMSEGGFDAIVNSIEQGAIRDQDIGSFRRDWLAPKSPKNDSGGHATIDGMMEQFNKAYPKEVYASHVWPMPVPKSADQAISGAIYSNGKTRMKWDGNHFQPVEQ